MLNNAIQALKILLAAAIVTIVAFFAVNVMEDTTEAEGGGSKTEVSSAVPSSGASPSDETSQYEESDPQSWQRNSELTSEDKRRLDTSVRRFARLYFSREHSQTEVAHRAAVAPFISGYFERKFYRFEPLAADESRVDAKPTGHSYGSYHLPEKSQEMVVAEVTIPVRFAVYDRAGRVSYTTRISQKMGWKLTPEGWKIHSFM